MMHCFSRLLRAALPPLAAAAVLLSPVALPAFPQPSLPVSSGNTTGTYYAASSAIAKIFNRKAVDYGMRIATVSTQGSVANVDSVLQGASSSGIAESVMLQRAAKGLD